MHERKGWEAAVKQGVNEGKKEDKYTRMDSNKDGQLDKAEWTAQGSDGQAFDRMDTNQDGLISDDERDTGRAAGTLSPGS